MSDPVSAPPPPSAARPVAAPGRTGTRSPGWVLGRVAGAPVVLAPSSVVAALVLAVVFLPVVGSQFPGLGVGAYGIALVFTVLLFASVLVHELAHGFVARSRGQQPHEFVLTLWGGHTSFGGASPTPLTSALVAVAGPAANLVLAGVGFAGASLVAPGGVADLLLWGLGVANAFVALFNLLPGLPLDGGRVVEAAVWGAVHDRSTGTRVAAWAGVVLAVGVPVWVLGGPLLRGERPSLLGAVWSCLLGAHLFQGARDALAADRWERRRDALRLEAVVRPAVTVPAGASVAHAVGTAAAAGAGEIVVLDEAGRPVGRVRRPDALAVPPAAAATTPVSAVTAALPAGAAVDGRLAGPALMRALVAACEHSDVAVAVVDGRVVGLVSAVDVVAHLRART
ncbi:site-2 protease family protein [Cellulomonas marina]|uniref:Zn-dependent protease (Includes SpoIVFB) n=1 Tax=Cellulomonas marina TaxID=988821 RepID=A0A1I0ZTU1_9CELL|nr:site-2 protease family protein [Cellulomonas marina]SFB27623.1 Zn-dependent protease (includes SpoIVFB) [Cellulomonas marina]